MNHRNYIGTVIAVNPFKVEIEINSKDDISYNIDGYSYFYEGINSYVSIEGIDNDKKIYQVINMFEKEILNNPNDTSFIESKYIIEAEPLGQIRSNEFSFGINTYPLLGDSVSITSEEEVKNIIETSGESLTLGKLVQKNIFPKISIDSLFSNHCCILGNTGSGKSTTVKTILRNINEKVLDRHFDPKRINLIVFDIHNEYYNNESENINKVDMKNEIAIDLKELGKEDWINLIDPSNLSQMPVLLKSLKLGSLLDSTSKYEWLKAYCALELYKNVQTDANAKKAKVVGLLESLSVESLKLAAGMFNDFGAIPNNKLEEFEREIKTYVEAEAMCKYEEVGNKLDYLLSEAKYIVGSMDDLEIAFDLVLLLEEMKGNSQIRSYCSTLITRIETLNYNYNDNLFSRDDVKLGNFLGIFNSDSAITILDVSKFDDIDLKFISSFLLKFIMKKQKDLSIDKRRIYNIIFDEAHRYITYDNQKDIPIIYERVAKEGRKHGVFLIIASQRPSELSSTVLSQCNNYFIHRIRNNVDLEYINKSIPFITYNGLKRISFLPTGVTLCLGDSFSVPFELKITKRKEEQLTSVTKPSDQWLAN